MVYSDALARVHAAGFAPALDEAADWLAAQAEGRAVFDIGCGDGRMLALLAERGVVGQGIDISAPFVALARARGLNVSQGSCAEALVPDDTGLILALGEVLNYSDDGSALATKLIPRLANLPDGTTFIADMLTPDAPPGGGWLSGDGWLVPARSHRKGNVYTREIVTFTQSPNGWHREDEIHTQITLSRADMKQMLDAAGFTAAFAETLGGADLLPGRLAVIARKT